MLVHIIADYGMGDLAFAEVVQRIKVHLPDIEPVLTPVPAFSTIAAGFCIAQLGLHPSPPGTLIYHNVAPREDDPAFRAKNAGERLAPVQPSCPRLGHRHRVVCPCRNHFRGVTDPALSSNVPHSGIN